MVQSSGVWKRFEIAAGFVCLAATFLLLSPGVRIVRADGDPASMASTDPMLVAEQSADGDREETLGSQGPAAAPPARVAPSPAAPSAVAEPEARAGRPAREVAPGIVVLNTRGYNYGPPIGEVAPEALQHETATP